MTFVYFLICLLLVGLLVMLRSVKITAANISKFELARRIKQHEVDAVLTKQRDDKLPDVLALRSLIETLLGILLIAVLIVALGLWKGLLAVLVLQLAIPKLSSFPLIGKPGQNFFNEREAGLLDFAHKYHNLLKYFRQPSISPQASPVYSKEELLHIAEKSNDLLSRKELKLLEHGLKFEDKKVSDIMTPASEVEFVTQDDVLGPVVLDRLHKSEHDCFPVVKKDLNHVVGMLFMNEIGSLPRQLTTAKSYMRPNVYYIREDQSLEQALHGFLHSHRHLFIVINELRETVGVISLHDVVKSLFGRKLTSRFEEYDDIREAARQAPADRYHQTNNHEEL